MTAIKNGTLLVKDSNGNTARVATLSQTDITTLNTALTDIEANKRKISSINANYVTTNTAQDITGKKTLTTTNKTEAIIVKVTNTDSAVTPTEDLWVNAINCTDKNDKEVGKLQFIKRTDGSHWTGLQAVARDSNGNKLYKSLGVSVNSDGTASTNVPKPDSNSNDNNIATTSWVNDKVNPIKNNYVTTNTVQTITEHKIFTQKGEPFHIKDDRFDNTKTPTEQIFNSIVLRDKNNKLAGMLQFSHNTSGQHLASIAAIAQNTNGSNIYGALTVGIKSDGTASTFAPNPASNSNDTSIATTAWVNAKISTGATSSNKVVTIDTAQTITGQKTFTAAVKGLSFTATSDKRLKEDIKEVSFDLSSLKTYSYSFKQDKDKRHYVGLIAQEVEAIIPDAVRKDSKGYLSLDYNAIVAALVTEVNQLKKRIEVLENK